MDLRTTLSIREELERGLETLLGAVSGKKRHPAPAPHGGAQGRRTRQRLSAQAPWNESRISLTRSTPVWASTSGLR